MQEIDKIQWASYKKEFKGIYILTISALIAGLSIDLLYRENYQVPVLILDMLTLFCWLISLGLILSKKIKLTICFGIAAYALLFNNLFTYSLNIGNEDVLLTFYRDTVFIAFILTLSAYFVNKYHAFIMAGIYVSYLPINQLINPSVYFQNSATVIFGMVAYSFIIYYFVRMQENTMDELNNKNNQVMHQNDVLMQKQEEIISQTDILLQQKRLIESRNDEIMEGIRFAKSIQESVLTNHKDFEKHFNQYFVISKPKEIVSGDFFWIKEWKGTVFLSLVDCTGHGVPGALVSMLANMYLGRAFIELDNPDPAKILSYISRAIATELRLVDTFHSRIGMDIACLKFDFNQMKLQYAAAFSPLYMIRRDNLFQYEANRLIMGLTTDEKKTYNNQDIDIKKGDRLYLFSDGITDQFGGVEDKKFGYKRFRNALVDTNHVDLNTQKNLFWKKWTQWKGQNIQTDDALLLGFEI